MNDEPTCNVCILFQDHDKAIDHAIWLNFRHRQKETQIFHVIDSPSGDPAVVSDDIWESFTDAGFDHSLNDDYTDLSYERIDSISSDSDPLYFWEEIRGMMSVTDIEVLQFILDKKIPLERFIRQELTARGYDDKGMWIGFEEAKKLWQK